MIATTTTTTNPFRLWFAGLVLALASAMISTMVALPARADTPDPDEARAFVERLADDFFSVVRNEDLSHAERRNELREMMYREVAVDYISMLSLGRHSRPRAGMAPDERAAFDAQIEEYKALFPEYIFEKFYDMVFSRIADTELEIRDATPVRNTDVFVRTLVHRPGEDSINAEWRVRANRDGELKIIDLRAEGVSMTITQREDFSSMIGGGGDLEPLLRHMRASVEAHRSEDAASETGSEDGDGGLPDGEADADDDGDRDAS